MCGIFCAGIVFVFGVLIYAFTLCILRDVSAEIPKPQVIKLENENSGNYRIEKLFTYEDISVYKFQNFS